MKLSITPEEARNIHSILGNKNSLTILWLIRQFGSQRKVDIQGFLGLTFQAMNFHIASLEKIGFVTRKSVHKRGRHQGNSQKAIDLNMEMLPFYMTTLMLLGESSEMKALGAHYQEYIKELESDDDVVVGLS
ncbi:MarR family transcriptional regulator [Dyadobacter chenwenxiniae]|uniref:MarR family transcriptional regulator n=1 Tax=Dyadobacter chenwenxiniae TaxID=2906456 RepID=A0A9X1PHH6_9BACT|nr:MarR family transcriptional regulator [Dyadobacter chenwenxiniae]MCF0059969.1 MarR family transcriptional regulator [Dyadobacter chenwenxiniae]UON85708.1 MarR family transcriptional regulator [Dyadobacter chenwenxiniae]